MNKQILIDTVKGILEYRYVTNIFSCADFTCDRCPAARNNNADEVSCFISKRYETDWLQNWLKENDTADSINDLILKDCAIKFNDIVISRELLDEVIKSMDSQAYNGYYELYEKLVKLRGEK